MTLLCEIVAAFPKYALLGLWRYNDVRLRQHFQNTPSSVHHVIMKNSSSIFKIRPPRFMTLLCEIVAAFPKYALLGLWRYNDVRLRQHFQYTPSSVHHVVMSNSGNISKVRPPRFMTLLCEIVAAFSNTPSSVHDAIVWNSGSISKIRPPRFMTLLCKIAAAFPKYALLGLWRYNVN